MADLEITENVTKLIISETQETLSIIEEVLQINEVGLQGATGAGATIDDTVYGVSWNGDVTNIASKNSIYDKIEGLSSLYQPIGSYQPLDADLTSLAGLGSTGIVTRTASNTFTTRTITGTTNQVNVSNGDGVSGNPTLSLPQNIHSEASPTFTGLTLSGLTDGRIVFPASGVLTGSSNIFWDNSANELRLGGATTQNAKLVIRTEASDLYGIYLDSSTTPFNIASGQHVGQRLVINGATSSSGYPVSITGQNLTLTNTANVTLIDDEEGWVNYGFQGNAAASGNVSYSPISSNGEYNKAFYFTFNRSGNVTNTEHSVVQDAMDIASINTQIFNNAGGTFYQYLSGLRLVSTGTGNCTAGALTRENKGIDITVFNFGSGNITSTAYGLFLNPNSSLVGTSWGIYDAWGANHWLKGKVYSGSTEATPTARLHLAAHSTAAASAPIKLTSGTAMTTPENGALEYHSSHLYFTIGSTRHQLDQQGGSLSVGDTILGASSFVLLATGTDGVLIDGPSYDDLGILSVNQLEISTINGSGDNLSISATSTIVNDLTINGSLDMGGRKIITVLAGYPMIGDGQIGGIGTTDLKVLRIQGNALSSDYDRAVVTVHVKTTIDSGESVSLSGTINGVIILGTDAPFLMTLDAGHVIIIDLFRKDSSTLLVNVSYNVSGNVAGKVIVDTTELTSVDFSDFLDIAVTGTFDGEVSRSEVLFAGGEYHPFSYVAP